MKCPNCGAAEQARVLRCQMCGAVYTSEDSLEVSQLEFLLAETAAWPEADAHSKPYADRLAALKARILPALPAAAAEAQPPAAVSEPEAPPPELEVEPAFAHPAPKPAPVRPAPERIPFDQWLLSERNIKIALYTGGALLVLAGLIFVAVNWARISGPAKFAITLMVTGLMYLGGYLLFQRPTLRLGGVALLGVASGFVPLNFVVLQIYIFSERGLSANVMWLIGSLPTLLLYALTAYWTRADLFTYLGLGAVASALTAALVLLGAPPFVFALAYTLLALVFLLGARAFQPTRLASFTRAPLLIVSHLAIPVLFVLSAAQWASMIGCEVCPYGSPWLALAVMFGGVVFYVVTDMVFRSLIARRVEAFAARSIAAYAARWVAAFAFAVTFVFALIQLRFSDTAIGISLKVLALTYLLVGYSLGRRADKPAAWPLYVAGYVVAAFVTLQAIPAFDEGPADLANALVGDAILLAVSARVHRQYEWIYGAAWVLIAPVFIYSGIYLQGLSNQAVRLVLALAYLLAGYNLERRLGRRDVVWLYAAGYAVAALVTLQALTTFSKDPIDLANALIGDVILLAVSAWVHRRYEWIYGAAWLFIAPVFIYAGLYVRGPSNQGVVLGVLMLNYVAAGYALGRRALRLGGPFLTAAVFLSVVVVVLTWNSAGVASIALVVIAALYLFAALWLRWSWLLLPALVTAHVAVVAILRVFFTADSPWAHTLTVICASLGVALTLGGARLRRMGQPAWGWPLYLVAAFDLAGSYAAGLLLGGPIAIGLSAVFALLALSLAWVERTSFADSKLPPLLSYLGVALVFVGHFYVLGLSSQTSRVWPVYTAGLCALGVALAWLLRREPVRDVYGTPLRWAGLCLMLVPLVGALSVFGSLSGAVSFAIAGITYAADAAVRRSLRVGFLGGVVILAWSDAVVASIALVLIAALYLLAALRLRWSGLLLPALVAVNLAVVTILRVFFTTDSPWAQALTIIYASLGVALTLGGARLRRMGLEAWGWPLYLVAAFDLAGSYIGALLLGGWIVIGLSVVFAPLALGLAWVERTSFAKAKLPPLLTYLGVALVFVGHFFVTSPASQTSRVWPAYAAGLCALFVALAWLLRHEPVRDVYGTPLRWAGHWLMLVPLVGALAKFDLLLIAVSFAIAGIACAFEAVVRRIPRLGYLAGGAFIIVIWAMLRLSDVRELQAYVIPLGLGLVVLGWSERRLGGQESYRWPTLLGLFILMGSTFLQSLDAVIYAVLLLAESLAALAWGVRIHSRSYVQLGVLSLVVNAVAQFGPAFVELPRWVQLAGIGSLLLGGGLVALFRREQLLAARQRLTDEWRRWEA